MTCNQLMVLLDIHCGTFRENRHTATVTGDMMHLLALGLITRPWGRDAVTCTGDGANLVERTLKME